MLSLKEGTKIAKFVGGDMDGKYLYIKEVNTDKKEKKVRQPKDPFAIIGQDFFESKNKKLKGSEVKILSDALKAGEIKHDFKDNDKQRREMEDLFERGQDEIKRRGNRREIKLYDGKLQPIPSEKHSLVTAGAPSGAGKSHSLAQYIKEYIKQKPKANIYLFSRVNEDPVLDQIKKIKRVPVDETFLPEEGEAPISASDFGDEPLIVFDDCDTIPDDTVKKAVLKLRDDCIEVIRHSGGRICAAVHQFQGYKNTRILLNETTDFIFFPGSGSKYGIEQTLKRYCGMDAKNIKKIMNLPSRWVWFKRNCPQCIIYETGAYLL